MIRRMHPNGTAETVVVDRAAVGRCFGCGQANEQGLRLIFARYPDGTIESRHVAAPHHCGVDTVVHGGIQATLLDEVMGVAAQLGLDDAATDAPCVTAEMQLAYRQPVPMADEVVVRARLVEVDGRDLHIEGAIVGADGTLLTTALSRWRQLRDVPSHAGGR